MMNCERILPRSKRPCGRPSTQILLVEMTGEKVALCDQCSHLYMQGVPVTYAPRRPG